MGLILRYINDPRPSPVKDREIHLEQCEQYSRLGPDNLSRQDQDSSDLIVYKALCQMLLRHYWPARPTLFQC